MTYIFILTTICLFIVAGVTATLAGPPHKRMSLTAALFTVWLLLGAILIHGHTGSAGTDPHNGLIVFASACIIVAIRAALYFQNYRKQHAAK